jgi:hypothetical protein
MSPDHKAFEIDTAKPDFRLGLADGRWRLLETQWPHAWISVRSKDGIEWLLRFDLTGYRATAPTATFWDRGTNSILAKALWPKGQGGRVTAAFNPEWQNGAALYLPCDRISMVGHDGWKTELACGWWRPEKGIMQYLEMVHELLNCRDYSPAIRAAA